MGVLWIALGASALVKHDDVIALYALFGALCVAMGVYRFVDRRNNPDPSEPAVGSTWKTGDGRRMTVGGIDGAIVRCSRFDPRTGTTAAWVGSREALQELVGLGHVAGNEPPRAQRA
jgi:hypothetical protein